MDLQDQLRNLFPDFKPEEPTESQHQKPEVWLQDEPLICKFEKRNGKPLTIIVGYNGAASDFKKLTRMLQSKLGVGGSFKNEEIFIQGNNRDSIMTFLKEMGFRVKRVGG